MNLKPSVRCLAAGLILCVSNVAGAADTTASPKSPEETIALLLFGFGYADPCKAAYGKESCPLSIGDHTISVNDGTYDHAYSMSPDYCVVNGNLRHLKSGETLHYSNKLAPVVDVAQGNTRFTGRSVEVEFLFSSSDYSRGEAGQVLQFTVYHEYFAFDGKDLAVLANSELAAMQVALRQHQQRYCSSSS